MKRICTERMTVAQVDEHLALAASVYDTPVVTNKSHFVWKHCENPSGTSICVALRTDEGELVGRMLLQPRQFITAKGDALRGATITDFVLDPKHRSAAQIIGMIKAAKAPLGISLVLHSSNEVSDPLYSQLFKFKTEFVLEAFGIPVRLTRLLRRYTSSEMLRSAVDLLISPARLALCLCTGIQSFRTGIRIGICPPETVVNDVLQEFKACAGPHFERTSSFMKWRFDESPLFPGHVEWLWQGSECLGFMAWQQFDKRDIQILAITDLVTRRPLTGAQATAVKLIATSLCIERGLDAVFTLVNTNNSMLAGLSGFPFMRIPARQLPHPSPIYLHADSGSFPPEYRAKTYLSLADLDYF